MNAIVLLTRAFDPYPFILLNLVLSCLAALKAPVIMMSQNRQEEKDRIRAENDYKINLKAELEIRHLHEKLDHLLTKQWTRLMEIQQIQIELFDDLLSKKSGGKSAPLKIATKAVAAKVIDKKVKPAAMNKPVKKVVEKKKVVVMKKKAVKGKK